MNIKKIEQHPPFGNVTITFYKKMKSYAVAQEVLKRYQKKDPAEELEIICTPDKMEGYSIFNNTIDNSVNLYSRIQ